MILSNMSLLYNVLTINLHVIQDILQLEMISLEIAKFISHSIWRVEGICSV